MHESRRGTQAGRMEIFLGEMTLEKRYRLSRGARKDRKQQGVIKGDLLRVFMVDKKKKTSVKKTAAQCCSLGWDKIKIEVSKRKPSICVWCIHCR